ncbi:MAG: arginase family protein [Candidatus Aenigmarchaeota archaeon]|nr:arginase family protein [Candidatus Aenigmarchaeota archaeon]
MKFTDDLSRIFTEEESNILVLGVPLGKHGRESVKRLRKISNYVEPFDIEKQKNLFYNIRIKDIGDVKLKNLSKKIKQIISNKKIPLILGGGHLLSLYSFQPFQNTKLIVFDAHADLKQEFDDEKIRNLDYIKGKKFNKKINDATWLRRVFDNKTPEVMIIGLRSCEENEFEFMKKNKIKYFTPNKMKNIKKEIEKFTKNSKIYISLDLDVFDPGIAPGVDQAEPNGINFKQFSEIINSIKGKIVGVDVNCLKPLKDNEITEFLAIRSLFEIIGKISEHAGVA